MSGVELNHVTIRFGNFTAVDDANLRIETGEFFSFLGPSGCGKTTILRAISGFTEPSEGTVLIGDKDMRGIGPNLRPTALIFQNLALFPLMTVADNIAFGLEVRGVAYAERRRRAEELLNLIALPGQGDKMVAELSGGQRQRIALARALYNRPQVLILDEATSALDDETEARFMDVVYSLNDQLTIIMVAHRMSSLSRCDKIFTLTDGKLTATQLAETMSR